MALAGLALAACTSSEQQVAVGADVDRAAEPSTSDVRFVDVAAEVGLDFTHSAFHWGTSADTPAMMGSGLCWIDQDGDGWLDLFVVNTWSNGEWGRWRADGALPTSHLYRNDHGRFVDVTEETGAGIETRANGCVAADLDLDGHTDLYVTTDRANVLLWNDGDKLVADDSPDGPDAGGWHTGAAVGDIDGNGWPDLFVTGYTNLNGPIPGATGGFPAPYMAEPDLLYLNEGPGDDGHVTFREVASEVGIEADGARHGLGAVFSDVDGDGDLDLYVANDTDPNSLYLSSPADNALGFELVDEGAALGVDSDAAGMGVAIGDYRNDGRPGIVVTNLGTQGHDAYRNTATSGRLGFEDALPSMGQTDLGVGTTGWGVNWADIDLDGDLDLLVVAGGIPVRDLEADRQPLLGYANRTADGDLGRLDDVSSVWGLDDAGPYLGRGSAVADYDNDGDLDVAVATVGSRLALLRNTGAGGHWLEVAPPTPEPGAVVTLTLSSGKTLRRELVAGSSYLSSEDPRAHFGLGTDANVREVTVTWPDGSRTTRADVAADQILELAPRD